MEVNRAELIARIEHHAGDAAALEALEVVHQQEGAVGPLLAILERIAEKHPARRDVVEALLRLTPREAPSQERLIRILDGRVRLIQETGGTKPALSAAYADLGAAWEFTGAHTEKALSSYRQAILLDARNLRALYGARQLLLGARDHHEAARMYELEITAEAHTDRKVLLLLELGHMRMEHLQDVPGAVEAFERAHNLNPHHPMATRMLTHALTRRAEMADPEEARRTRELVASLYYDLALAAPAEEALTYAEEALTAAPHHGPALELLERVAEQTGREDLLPIRWVGYLEHAPESPMAAARRRRLGRAYLENRQPMDAIACLEPLLERGDPEAADLLVDLYRRSGRDEDAARALATALAGLSGPSRVPRLRDILHIRIDQGRHPEALQCAKEILALSPTDEAAFDLVEAEYLRAHDYAALRALYEAAAGASEGDPARQKRYVRDLARLLEASLNDTASAVIAWQLILDLDPNDTDAPLALERLLEAHERWDELAALLASRSTQLKERREAVRVLRKLARIERTKLGDTAAAVTSLKSLHRWAPDDIEAQRSLAELLSDQGEHADALGFLRTLAAVAPPGLERAALYHRIGTLLEHHLSDDDGAFAAYASVVEDAPTHEGALEAMARIDERHRRWPRLLQTLAYHAEVAQERRKTALLVRMAEIAEGELRDFTLAADHYGQALVVNPDNEAVMDALARTYGRAGRHRDLVAVLYRKAKRTTDAGTRAKLHRRIARTLGENLENEDAAHEAWKRVLADDPHHEEALRGELDYARRTGTPEDLADLLGRLTPVVETDLERVDLMVQRANVLTTKLGRRQDALVIMRKVVDEVDGTHLGALDWLAAFYEDAKNYTLLAEMLERQIAVATDPQLRGPIARRLADVRLHRLADGPRALEALEVWRQSAPDDPEPLRRIVTVLELEKRWPDLRHALDQLATLDTPTGARQATLRSADITATLLHDAEGAFTRVKPLAENGDPEALALLQRIERKESIAPDAAEMKLRRAEAETGIDAKQALFLDAARLLEASVKDANRAYEATKRAFEIDPLDDGVLQLLERRADMVGRGPELAALLETTRSRLDDALRAAPHGKPRVVALLALARFAWARLGDAATFERCLAEALVAADKDDSLVGRIERTVIGLDAPTEHTPVESLVAELQRHADRLLEAEDLDRSAALLARAGRLLAVQLGAPWEALEVLKRASLLVPGHEGVLDELESVCRRAGAMHELEQHLDVVAEHAMDAKPATVAMKRRAQVLMTLARHGEAADVFAQLWGMHPDDKAIPEALAECLRKTERYQELVGVLERMLERAKGPTLRAPLLREIAHTWEFHLENPWEAKDAWQALLRSNPGDAEAKSALIRVQDDLHVPTDPEMRRTERPGSA